MAILKAINSRASLGNAIHYITKKEKTEAKFISGFNSREDMPLLDIKKSVFELFKKIK